MTEELFHERLNRFGIRRVDRLLAYEIMACCEERRFCLGDLAKTVGLSIQETRATCKRLAKSGVFDGQLDPGN